MLHIADANAAVLWQGAIDEQLPREGYAFGDNGAARQRVKQARFA
jgi:hypothetical protein